MEQNEFLKMLRQAFLENKIIVDIDTRSEYESGNIGESGRYADVVSVKIKIEVDGELTTVVDYDYI